MKRFGLILMMCLLLAGCGQAAPTEETGPEVSAVVEQSVTAEAKEEETKATETVEPESSEEVVYDIIPEEYAYSLTVSINPLVKLYFDASDIIVGVEYQNEDAIEAYADLKLVGASSKEGLESLIDAAVDKNYLKEDGQISIELTEVVDTVAITENTPLMQAKEIVAERIVKIAEAEETDAEETKPALQVSILVDVAEDVTEKTGIKPTVVCPDCNGTGNDCKECNGTAIVNCKRCNGGWETCGICNGSGHEICHGCKGTGIDNGNTCTRCGGSGKQNSCTGCKGAGGFECSWCKGALQHVCPECWGEKVCDTCGGTGTI